MLLLSVLALSAINKVYAAIGPTVTLDYGTFTGHRDDSAGIISYRGIRYADAPVGELRWRAPISPPTNNLGNVDATQFADACIQTAQTTIAAGFSEDCLFGNVYIPTTKAANETLPVLVWFHGGGFQGGSTHDIPNSNPMVQPPAYPVVFVSFEYRLGQFGFLGGARVKNDGDLNIGLLDQRAALRWVQRYIGKFGGDKSRVTIWGQSAGAGSTMFHLLAEGGNPGGLFRAAMGDSPSLNFMPAYTDPYVEGIFDQFASFAGCGGKGDEVMKCLRFVDGSRLALAGSQTIGARTSTLFTFAPIIDDAFLKERPVEAFKNGRFAHVPVLFGSNTNEGAWWSAFLPNPAANTSMTNATETTVFNFLQGQFATLTRASFDRAVAQFYPLSDYGTFSLQGQQMYGEMRYICTASLITGGAFDQGLPAYQFHYNNPILGSDHTAELTAFFSSSPPSDEGDKDLFAAMREYWTNFAATGIPRAKNAPSWSAVTTSAGSPRIRLQPGSLGLEEFTSALAARCAFWHGISGELNV
ncbi:putative carboxylesterase [Lyophyllum shimeji]|uniref:Carboxylic ester hydrolase n=1 Tax=Lyophyllum shimeji TaxID=47721 RepID=A0A9P3PCR1_LYOSH|nr:putative carboxylesterase [Lyophyllum shimeji]